MGGLSPLHSMHVLSAALIKGEAASIAIEGTNIIASSLLMKAGVKHETMPKLPVTETRTVSSSNSTHNVMSPISRSTARSEQNARSDKINVATGYLHQSAIGRRQRLRERERPHPERILSNNLAVRYFSASTWRTSSSFSPPGRA